MSIHIYNQKYSIFKNLGQPFKPLQQIHLQHRFRLKTILRNVKEADILQPTVQSLKLKSQMSFNLRPVIKITMKMMNLLRKKERRN